MIRMLPFYHYLSGLSTLIPGLHSFAPVGGTSSAIYSLHVFLRHISNIYLYAQRLSPPRTILELGPGNSLGFGLTAMLAYDCDYIALDVDNFFEPTINLSILDDLYNLYSSDHFSVNRIPDDFLPKCSQTLTLSDFFSWAGDKRSLEARYRLIKGRLENPLSSIAMANSISTNLVNYSTQHYLSSRETPLFESIDCIFSQATLEHVDELAACLIDLRNVSTPNTLQSHEIDLTSHNITREWNGHWGFSDRQWFVIRGYRPHYVNRRPLSYYLSLLNSLNYKIVRQELYFDSGLPSIPREKFKIPVEDLDLRAHSCYLLFSTK